MTKNNPDLGKKLVLEILGQVLDVAQKQSWVQNVYVLHLKKMEGADCMAVFP